MSQSAAAVIDLDSFRRERQQRAERPERPAPRPLPSPVCMVPVLVAWIPVWPVA
ncbi:MAG TPA: hypothetical protein VF904_17295 [Anaeromyxobacteraceae bacterium]